MAKSSILLAYYKTGSCSSTVKESRIITISVHMIHQKPNCSYSLVHPIASYKGRSKKDKKTILNQNRVQKVWRVDGRESDNGRSKGGGDHGGRGGVAAVVVMNSISGMEKQKMARDRRRCGMAVPVRVAQTSTRLKLPHPGNLRVKGGVTLVSYCLLLPFRDDEEELRQAVKSWIKLKCQFRNP
ncbi:hypothetical protein DY000_02030620 [Brassica cretica]|uniref:Uncharacterized protein n=1 Tax=Brassica cretica TaxID=69181 RepID=A0ABQ7DGF0_BRACR|nr:hypothetical protein DY000_02030620 [Brassica cretica]